METTVCSGNPPYSNRPEIWSSVCLPWSFSDCWVGEFTQHVCKKGLGFGGRGQGVLLSVVEVLNCKASCLPWVEILIKGWGNPFPSIA